jgi:hypothetical protein
MQELGRRGLRATADRYFGGSVAECMAYLRKKGAEVQIATLADEEGMRCVEVPVLLDPDDDPFFQEPAGIWQERTTSRPPSARRR